MRIFVGMMMVVVGAILLLGAGEAASQPGTQARTQGGGSATSRAAGLIMEGVKMPGGVRSWLVHVPKGWGGKTKLAVVICLHGATDNAAYAAEAYGWVEKADKDQFMVVFPEGLGDGAPGEADDGKHYWDPGYMNAKEETDDVRFLAKMIDIVEAKGTVDAERVYVCGHSNGAVMAYMMGARYPKKIAGLGIVAGSVGVQDQNRKEFLIPTPAQAVPVIIFHGKEDPNLPYDPPEPPAGEVKQQVAVYQYIGVPASVRFWLKVNGCVETPRTKSEDGEVTREYYYPKKKGEGAMVEMVTLLHGNHMWPGAKAMPGKTQLPSAAADATAEMWNFWTRAKAGS